MSLFFPRCLERARVALSITNRHPAEACWPTAVSAPGWYHGKKRGRETPSLGRQGGILAVVPTAASWRISGRSQKLSWEKCDRQRHRHKRFPTQLTDSRNV